MFYLPARLQLLPHGPSGGGPLIRSRHGGGAGRDGLQGQRGGGSGGGAGVGEDLGRAYRGRARARSLGVEMCSRGCMAAGCKRLFPVSTCPHPLNSETMCAIACGLAAPVGRSVAGGPGRRPTTPTWGAGIPHRIVLLTVQGHDELQTAARCRCFCEHAFRTPDMVLRWYSSP